MAKIRISNAGGAVIDIGNLDAAGPEAQAIVDQAVNQYQAGPLSQATPPPAPTTAEHDQPRCRAVDWRAIPGRRANRSPHAGWIDSGAHSSAGYGPE